MLIKYLGCCDYLTTLQSMQTLTEQRDPSSQDQIWLVTHPPTYTMGLAAQKKHVLNPGSIPVVQSNRGGEVTYHGPGQLVIYLMLDLKRLNLNLAQLVEKAEQCIIDYCATLKIQAHADKKARGIYIDGAKLAALGFKIHRHRCYHGMALNVRMDLSPYLQINPCGHQNLAITQLADWIPSIELSDTIENIQPMLKQHFQPI